MDRRVYNWPISIRSILFPPTCVLCGASGSKGRDLCIPCERDLPRIPRPCPRCGEALPQGGNAVALCGACQKRPPPFDACYTALAYVWPVPPLVAELKFQGKLATGRLLADLLGDALEARCAEMPELILPVPLHPGRERERGYNQALELARPLGRRFGIPVNTGMCQRTRPTLPQVDLDRTARQRNLRGAFSLSTVPLAGHLAVLDDVVTTGSTAGELARLLKGAGADRVDVWCAARALTRPS